jgi:Protein of unknown function (DUF3396)
MTDSTFTDKEATAAYRSLFKTAKAIVVKNKYDRVAARVGWSINLVFLEGDTVAVRERAWQVFDFFCSVVDPNLLVYWHGGMPTPLTGKIGQRKISEKREYTVSDPKAFAMYFNMASGSPKPPEAWVGNAQDYLYLCRVKNDSSIWDKDRFSEPGCGPQPSYLRICLPVSWIEAHPGDRGIAWFTNEVVRLMQPLWATAGWGIVPAVEESNISRTSEGQMALYPWLMQFPALDANDGVMLGYPQLNKAMLSVNWLNYVSDPLLEPLGGRERVRTTALESPYLDVRDIGNCLLVAAGPFPHIGAGEGVKIPAFGDAARLLKPIRVKEIYNSFIGRPPRGDGDEEGHRLDCDAYLRRFDDH